MRLSVFFTFLFIAQTWATPIYSQQTRLSLSMQNVRVMDVLNEIERSSEFFFFFNEKLVNVDRKVDLIVKDGKIEEILYDLFKGTDVNYKVIDKQIILTTLKGNSEELQQNDRNVSGKVTDRSGLPLPGVTITVKGTTKGVITDNDGSFSLLLPAESKVLVFSFVGMRTMEVILDNQKIINIVLEEETIGLEEVVAIGYGTTTRRAVTGAITKVTSEELMAHSNANVASSIQGRAAGVQITQNSGKPDDQMRIRIRGNSSIGSNGDPLIVIDGMPVPSSAYGSSYLSQINSEDIASIDILKDAASASIYGSRAANGVLLITTKKGKDGKGKIDVSYEQGVTTPAHRVDLMNSDEYISTFNRGIANRKLSGLGSTTGNKYYLIPQDFNVSPSLQGYDSTYLFSRKPNTNWMDQVMGNGDSKKVSVSVSTGTQKTTIFMSGSFRDENSMLIGDKVQRMTGRINIDHVANKHFKTGVNVTIVNVNKTNLGGFFKEAQNSLLPIYPIYAPDTTGYRYFGDYIMTNNIGNINPLFNREQTNNKTNSFRNLNNVYVEISPIADLSFRSEFSLDFDFNHQRSYQSQLIFPANAINNKGGGNGSANNSRNQNFRWNWNNLLIYNKTFASTHKINLLLGITSENNLGKGQTSIKEGFLSPLQIIDGNTWVAGQEYEGEARYISAFSRFNYALKGKYFIDGSIRRDGSNRFGPGKRFGYFPGLALGWAVSDENFLKNNSVINQLKARASFGATGNDQIGDFRYLSLVYANWNAGVYSGNQGVIPSQMGNTNFHWEKTDQFNFGIDYGLFGGKISGSLEYYIKKSTDLLLSSPGSHTYGWEQTSFIENIGDISNRGLEFSVTAHLIESKKLKWSVDFNISSNKTMVDKLVKNNGPDRPGTMGINIGYGGGGLLVEGQPFGAYSLPVFAGFDPISKHELFYEVNKPLRDTKGIYEFTGNLIDGTRYNVPQDAMLITDKTSQPKFFGGFGTNLEYKGFDLYAFVYYQYGNWILDMDEVKQSYVTSGQQMRKSTIDNPNLIYGQSAIASTRFLHDGSFIRLRDLQLGYNLPASWTSKMKIGSARVYVSGQNLFTITKYKGWDPEVYGGSTNNNALPSVASGNFPQAKTYMFGVRVGF